MGRYRGNKRKRAPKHTRDLLDPANNPLAKAFKAEPKLTDEQREQLEEKALREQVAAEMNKWKDDNAKEFARLQSLREDVSGQLDEAKIELKAAQDQLRQFNRQPTSSPVNKAAAFEIQKLILGNLHSVLSMMSTYKGKHQTEIKSFLNKLNSKSDFNDIRLMLKDPAVLKEMQFIYFKLRTSLEMNSNLIVRAREKPLYKLFANMPLADLFDPNWVPAQRTRLEADVNMWQKLVTKLQGRVADLDQTLSQYESNQDHNKKPQAEKTQMLTAIGSTSFFGKTNTPALTSKSRRKNDTNERHQTPAIPTKRTPTRGNG